MDPQQPQPLQRVDQRVMTRAAQAARDLLTAFPELHSLGIVFGWSFPPAAADGLPPGVWIGRPDTSYTVDQLGQVVVQCAKLGQHLTAQQQRVIGAALEQKPAD